MQFTIILPESLAVESRDQSVTLALGKLTPELIARAALHGFKQKVADAAAGAKKAAFRDKTDGETPAQWEAAFKAFGATPDEATAIATAGRGLMQKVVDALHAGEWGADRTGGGLTAYEVACARKYAEGVRMQFAKGQKTADRDQEAWNAFGASPEGTQVAVRKLVDRDIARKAEEDAELAALFGASALG